MSGIQFNENSMQSGLGEPSRERWLAWSSLWCLRQRKSAEGQKLHSPHNIIHCLWQNKSSENVSSLSNATFKVLVLGWTKKESQIGKCYFIKKFSSRKMCVDHLLLAMFVRIIIHLTFQGQIHALGLSPQGLGDSRLLQFALNCHSVPCVIV